MFNATIDLESKDVIGSNESTLFLHNNQFDKAKMIKFLVNLYNRNIKYKMVKYCRLHQQFASIFH